MLGREMLWSQGDQFSLFVILWLCQLPGRVRGSGLQLSTASASWIPTVVSIPGTAHLCKPGGIQSICPFPSLTPRHYLRGIISLAGVLLGFCSLA